MRSAKSPLSPHAIEPTLPRERGALRERAAEVMRRGASLGSSVHPTTRVELVRLLRLMNSYYSNLIEGQATRPHDIERALARDLSRSPAQRSLPLLAVAHVEAQEEIERRLAETPPFSPLTRRTHAARCDGLDV